MKLLSITLDGEQGYKGLTPDTFDFSQSEGRLLAFIGLNGSGKSQLLELIAESFAYLERKQRKDFKTRTPLGFSVTLVYQLNKKSIHTANSAGMVAGDPATVAAGLRNPKLKINIDLAGNITSYVYREPEWLETSFDGVELPSYVVGYSSGLNENLQRSFMKNAVQFFDVMRIRANRRKELAGDVNELDVVQINKRYLQRNPHIFSAPEGEALEQDGFFSLRESDTRTPNHLFMDYDCCALLMVSFAILPDPEIDSLLSEVRFKFPKLVKLKYNLRGGVVGDDSVKDIKLLIRAGGEDSVEGIGNRTNDEEFKIYDLDYLAGVITLDLSQPEIRERLSSANYDEPLLLFKRLYKLQLLGLSNWQGENLKKLRKCNFIETVKKPLKGKLPLSVERLELADENGQCVNFDDFSDGEAQLIQILAAARIFRDEQTLFLFDEPETHLNPSWRTYFHKNLANVSKVEYVGSECTQTLLSTHSPFMISSLKKSEVYRFEREDNRTIRMSLATEQTYGASFDVLIKKYFGLKSLISQSVIDEIREKLKLSDEEALAWINENLGMSPEKAYLQRKLSH
jgi:predicted ATPase